MSRLEKYVKSWHLESEERFLKTPVGIFLLGAFLGELSPDPTDAIHFWLQENVFLHPTLPAPVLIFLQIFDWYLMSAFYFLLLLILAYFLHIKKVNTVKRITVIGGLLGVGVVIGVLVRFFV